MTRPFRETAEDRARRDPAFKAELEAARGLALETPAKRDVDGYYEAHPPSRD